MPTSRRTFLAGALAGAGGLTILGPRLLRAADSAAARAEASIWPLYAFDNGLGTVPKMEDKVKLLKDLGYAGIEYHLDVKGLPRMLDLLDAAGLVLNAVYTTPFIEDPLPAAFAQTIPMMIGRPTRIEMGLRSREVKKPSDPAGDDRGADLLKQAGDLCGDTGPVVSVYPHTGFWTERVEDGVRLARRVGRGNVGTNFNLVHWYWVKPERSVEEALREARPHLMTVTINNGDKAGRRIAGLDDGDYDLVGVMRAVKAVGYTGMVGLQCYSVPGPAEEHLKRSMAKWLELRKTVLGEGA
jgi:sugar phosphate isomerase/epimerase